MRRRFWTAVLLALCVPEVARAASDLQDGVIGSACETDDDCIQGLGCVTAAGAELGGSGPAHGLCTARCASDDDCAPFWYGLSPEFLPVCAGVAGVALCLEPCPVGGTFPTVAKCHGREEMACQVSGRGFAQSGTIPLGVCTPQCTLDRQCGDRYCNAALGFCVDEPVKGDPVGASCHPDARLRTCAGYCNPAPPSEGGAGGETFTGSCTQSCIVGGPIACGWSGKATPSALCDDGGGTLGLGDLSQCVELCDCDTDCSAKGSVCAPLGSAYGHAGRCVPPGSSATQLSDCGPPPDAGQCVFGAVRTCRGKADCFGTAPCLEDKSGYAACECVDESPGGAASAGAGQAGAGEPSSGAPLGGAASGGAGEDSGGAPAGPSSAASRSGKTPEAGCSCEVPPSSSHFVPSAALFALGLSLVRRNRARRSRWRRRHASSFAAAAAPAPALEKE